MTPQAFRIAEDTPAPRAESPVEGTTHACRDVALGHMARPLAVWGAGCRWVCTQQGQVLPVMSPPLWLGLVGSPLGIHFAL